VNIELPKPADWSAGARSETGYKRNENQDRMSRISTALGDAYIVADGMGGHKGGALAAQMTVDALVRTLAAAEQPRADVATAIRQAFIAANTDVHQRAYSGDPETHAMGATGLLLLALRSSVIVAHVGDSRAYLVRDGKLRQLTRDHTRVQRMIDAGMLTEEQAESHPDAGVLERAIGHQRDVEVEVSEPLELECGDEILLCSDGLTSYVERAQIEAAVSRSNSPAKQVDELISLALASGGYDNVTVQVIRYEGGMNERKRQILTYQLAFLPLVAVVAAATAFGVDYMNRPQVEAAPASVAKAPPGTACCVGVGFVEAGDSGSAACCTGTAGRRCGGPEIARQAEGRGHATLEACGATGEIQAAVGLRIECAGHAARQLRRHGTCESK
jgi:serine/threonine protein phosphatase PrpC